MPNKVSSILQEYLQLGLAILLASIGLKAFLLPNGFLDGGVTGIAILISELFGFDVSVVLVFASIPFFILGYITLSRYVLLKSIFAVVILALVIYFENFQSVTDEKLLIAIFGGIFLGAGIGLAIKNGAALDGAEILGIQINDKFGIPIGTVVLIFNTILFSITAYFVSVEVALYSILTFIITGKVIDFVFEGFEDYVGLTIISEKNNEIHEALLTNTGIGLTIFEGTKGFGSKGEKSNFEIIQTVLNRIDSKKVHNLIDSIDNDAFVIEFDVNGVKGGRLRKYLSR